ncbi:unnamed protein product [Orchesella dallaii]|uniref:EB domain-containing protein n=1 Tax=Orchesella dallaii TaxID=48710 RepID=A0ABP1PSD3_9HEXA
MRYLIPFVLIFLLKFAAGSNFYGDILIGETCYGDDEGCKGDPGITSFCDLTTYKCKCKELYIANNARDNCLKITNIGEECVEPQQCQSASGQELSDCVPNEEGEGEKVCKCTEEAIEYGTGTGKTCEKIATEVGETCHIVEQCTAKLGNLTTCESQSCECKPEAVPSPTNDKCLPAGIYIGQRCEATVQCVGDSSSSRCVSGICACLPTHTASNNWDDCLPIRNQEGQPCEEIQQCQQGNLEQHSNCTGPDPSNKQCQCTPNAISLPAGDPCRLLATMVGDPCVREIQCVFNLGESTCSRGFCSCINGAVESTNKTKCLLKSDLREECVDDTQCNWVEGAVCTSKNESDPSLGKDCRCGPDFATPEWETDVCYPKAEFIGRPCDKHPIQCVDLDGSQCLVEGKICACHEKTQVVSGDRKSCLQKVDVLNSTCVESPQCSETGAECVTVNSEEEEEKRECRCKRNEYVEGWNPNGKCLEIAHEIRENCKENHQCTAGLGSLSECSDGLCLCKIGNEYLDGRCYNPAKLEERCSSNGECITGVNEYAHCDNYVCRCVVNATDFEEKCYLQKVVGDNCENDKQCTIFIGAAATCDRTTRKCSCLMGYKPDLQNSLCVSGALRLETKFGIILLSIVFAFVQKLF